MTVMKSILISVFALFGVLFLSVASYAQDTTPEDLSGCTDGWKYAFSKDGRKEWKPEVTYRQYVGFVSSGPMLTVGARVDEKRTLSLMLDHCDTYIDAVPGDVFSVRVGVAFRRYVHLGNRQIFSLYSDIYTGAGYVYKLDSWFSDSVEDLLYRKGEVIFLAGWNPGVRIRFYKNIHIFFGPTFSTEPIFGFHVGVGF